MYNSYMRYLVKDEDGLALRAFRTKQEAINWMTKGETLVVLPKPPKVDLIALVGEAPF